jgi:hypothetical protein
MQSSEDDGMGGRRKKGLKEKIKEKMPGGHKDNHGQQATATGAYGGTGYAGPTTGTGTTGGGTYVPTTGGGTHEKKGVMEKIKEKIPGGHKDYQHTTAGTGGGYGGTTGTYGTATTTTTEGTHEKKGFMEKIKEKLPGQH